MISFLFSRLMGEFSSVGAGDITSSFFKNEKIYTSHNFNGTCRLFADRVYCFILSARCGDNRRCCERTTWKNNVMNPVFYRAAPRGSVRL